MTVTENLLEHAGFKPGQHVLFSVDYVRRRITITVDQDYMIADRPMTREQIRQRDTFRAD